MSTAGTSTLRPGEVFHARYRVVRCLKAGGMGAVYEVVDDRTNSPRALKVMLPSVLAVPDLRARFALEAKVTGNIASDHIVRVSDAGIDEATGTPFLVMDLLEGHELGSLLDKRGPLPPPEVVLYLHQTALALDKTHAAGIVHRDLKPENLFVTYRDDGSPCVKILDFGIAKVVEQSAARATRAMGTPMFMAPEQLRGESSIGPRTDLFALGHIAYALLAGEPYWNEEQLGAESIYPLLSKIMLGLKEAPAARARRRREVELPAAFDAWMSRATAARPEDRFERATVMVAALAEALGVAAPQVTPTSLDAARVSFVGGGTPSSLGYGSGPQRGATGVAVMSTPVVPRSRSALPLVIAAVVMAALGLGGFLALRAPSTSTVASAASMTVEPPRTTAAAVPLPTVSAEPSVAPAGTTAAAPPPEPAVTPTSKPAAAAPRSAVKPAVAGPAQPVPTAAPTATSGHRKDKDTIGF